MGRFSDEAMDAAQPINQIIQSLQQSNQPITKEVVWQALRAQGVNVDPKVFAVVAHRQMVNSGLIARRMAAGGSISRGQTVTSGILQNMMMMKQLFGTDERLFGARGSGISISKKDFGSERMWKEAWDLSHGPKPSAEFMKNLPGEAGKKVGGFYKFLGALGVPLGNLLHQQAVGRKGQELFDEEMARLMKPTLPAGEMSILPKDIGVEAASRPGRFPYQGKSPLEITPTPFEAINLIPDDLKLAPKDKTTRLRGYTPGSPVETTPADVDAGRIFKTKVPKFEQASVEIPEELRLAEESPEGMSREEIAKMLVGEPEKAKAKRKSYTKEQLAELKVKAIRFDKEGLSAKEIAAQLGMSESTIRKYLKDKPKYSVGMEEDTGQIFEGHGEGDYIGKTTKSGRIPFKRGKAGKSAREQLEAMGIDVSAGEPDLEITAKDLIEDKPEKIEPLDLRALMDKIEKTGEVVPGPLDISEAIEEETWKNKFGRAKGGPAFDVEQALKSDWAEIEEMIANQEGLKHLQQHYKDLKEQAEFDALPDYDPFERASGGFTMPRSMQEGIRQRGGNIPIGSGQGDDVKIVAKKGEYVVREEAMANPRAAAIVEGINESGAFMAKGGGVGARAPALDAPPYPRSEPVDKESQNEIKDLLREIRDLLKSEKGTEGKTKPEHVWDKFRGMFGDTKLEPRTQPGGARATIGDVLRRLGGA